MKNLTLILATLMLSATGVGAALAHAPLLSSDLSTNYGFSNTATPSPVGDYGPGQNLAVAPAHTAGAQCAAGNISGNGDAQIANLEHSLTASKIKYDSVEVWGNCLRVFENGGHMAYFDASTLKQIS